MDLTTTDTAPVTTPSAATTTSARRTDGAPSTAALTGLQRWTLTALRLGVGLRVSAVAGTVILLFMYLAEWPFAANAASTNPVVDYHLIFALSLILVAAFSAGDTFGLGRVWKSLPIVDKHRWLV
jgi:hypothetical protein